MNLRICSKLAALTLGAPLLFTGCNGYQVGTVKPVEYADIQSMYIPTFENDTLEPRLSALVTNAVISELHQDGSYTVASEANADVKLVGKIRRIWKYQQRAANNQIYQTTELLVLLEVRFDLIDLRTGQEIRAANPWGVDAEDVDSLTGKRRNSDTVVGRTSIFLDANFQLSERQALERAADDAAEQMVSALTDGW